MLALLALCLAGGVRAESAAPNTEPIHTLDRQRMPRLDATEYPLKGDDTRIFSVPVPHSIGTNSLGNAVTILDLSGPRVRARVARRNVFDPLSAGEMVFLADSSRDTIGYSQTRRFLLVNVSDGSLREYRVGRFIEDTIVDVIALGWTRKLFLINLNFVQMFREENDLLLLDLSGSAPKRLASFELKDEPRGVVPGKTSFFYVRVDGRLELRALDEHLRPTPHPLLDVYNSGLLPGQADLPQVHPTLPLAVFASQTPGGPAELAVWCASWGDGRPTVFKVSDSVSGSFQFSPDGKWLLFEDATGGPDRWVVMALDAARRGVFGPPILLDTAEKIPSSWNGHCAWMSDPVSVVCAVSRAEHIQATSEDRTISKLIKWQLPLKRIEQ